MSDRIRVLELRSVRGTGGGPEKTILLGAAQANRDRIDVIVCYLRDGSDDVFDLRRKAEALGVTYVEVEERHSFDISVWNKLLRLVRDYRVDLVHAHEYKTDALALVLARRTGVIPLATAHGWTGQSRRETLVYYPLDKRLLGRFPKVIAVSSDIKSEIVRHGGADRRVEVILNGIDPTQFRRDPARRNSVRGELGLAPELLVIAAVGRTERQKRFDLLLESFSRLGADRPAWRLAIVGDGSLTTELARLAHRLGLRDRCVFLGHRNDIATLHHAFDLFVQSSEYEGTPNAVLEAMAMETPIVATDAGGTGELLRSGIDGLLIPVNDATALDRAIVAAVENPLETRTRVAAARRRVENTLSFESRTRKLEAVYEEMVTARGTTSSGRSRGAGIVPHTGAAGGSLDA